MTYEIYRYIFIGCLMLSILLLVLAVVLFFTLRIPNVIGDLSGANARKAIENIRNQNESTGEKTYKSSKVNKERGRLTEKISGSGRLYRHSTDDLYGAMPTEKIGTQNLVSNETTVLDAGGNETTLLNTGGNETTVLNTGGNETTVLNMGGNETTVLNAGGNETTVLNTGGNETTVLNMGGNETTVLNMSGTDTASAFIIEFEITYIHTDEVIA